ncbi:hypothetical protein V6N12_076326 [Hibiscus sabdariffa]|uniref:Uncharacterized protein n=1 Tax=Hibiscus sabdariffa TaxID=183260 RepID=A0ABR2D9G6_9ROSI
MKRVRNEGDDKIDVEMSISVDVAVENESPKTLPIVVSSVNKTTPGKSYAGMVVGKDMRSEGVAEEICDEEISLTGVDVRVNRDGPSLIFNDGSERLPNICGGDVLFVDARGYEKRRLRKKVGTISDSNMQNHVVMSSRFQVLREEGEVGGSEELDILGASKKVESSRGKARAHGLTTTVQHKVAVNKHGNSPRDNTQILEVQDKVISLREGSSWTIVSHNPMVVSSNHTTIMVIDEEDEGLASSTFHCHFKDFMRIHHPKLVALMEPRVSSRKADNVLQQLGFTNSFRIKAHGLVKGIWLLCDDSIQVEVIEISNQFLHCRVKNVGETLLLFVTVVYASPSTVKQKFLWGHCKILILVKVTRGLLVVISKSFFDLMKGRAGRCLH